MDLPDSYLKTVDKWMEGQSIGVRYAVEEFTPPFIYAYVRVSLLVQPTVPANGRHLGNEPW